MRLDSALDATERRLAARDTTKWAEFARRIADDCHPDQRAFVLDPARYIAGLCGRGAGKTVAGRARFLRRLLTTPKANCFYLAKTRDHAERLMWTPLKEAFNKLGFVVGVDVIYHETKLRVTLPKTGGTLQLWGADKPGYVEALRGESYHEVGIDEAAIHNDKTLRAIVHSIIGPRLFGALFLIGTPGYVLKGLFYEVSRRGSTLGRLWAEREAHPDHRGWSVHKWTLKGAIEATSDRPITALIELYAIQQREIEDQQLSPDNPIRRREYDGEWVADGTAHIYTYRAHSDDGAAWNQWDPERVGPYGIAKLPEQWREWVHVIALDLGFTDPTAINVFAVAVDDSTRTIYHRLCFEEKGMYAQPIAHKLIGAELQHDRPDGIIGAIGEWPNGMVADSTHQMAMAILAELANVYGIHIEPATKGFRYKVGAIAVVNGDLVDGRIKVLKGSKLEEQLLDLQWEENARGEVQERKGQPNHSTDCMIYGRSALSQFMSAIVASLPPPRPNVNSPGYEPPMPTSPQDDYSALFQDDYSALLG